MQSGILITIIIYLALALLDLGHLALNIRVEPLQGFLEARR